MLQGEFGQINDPNVKKKNNFKCKLTSKKSIKLHQKLLEQHIKLWPFNKLARCWTWKKNDFGCSKKAY